MKNKCVGILFIVFLIMISWFSGIGQSGMIDHSFNPMEIGYEYGNGANNEIQASVVQGDGKIIIGGGFTSYNGTLRNYIARLNTDGTIDPTFDPGTGPNNVIQSIALQTDGKIIIGGQFTAYNGTAKNRIARLNVNGTLDGTFNSGNGANGVINTVAIQSDGKIIIGGAFTFYHTTPRNFIARLNFDGSIDGTFGSGAGANNTIQSTSIRADGKIIIGGAFSSYNGIVINKIACLNSNGTLDATFNPGTGPDQTPKTIAIQSDDKIIIGGSFLNYNSASRNYIARLNADGTLDEEFNPVTGPSYPVNAMAIQSDGKMVIGGNAAPYNGVIAAYITRLNGEGTSDETFNIGTGGSNTVFTIAMQSDGKIVIGGHFTSYNGKARNRIARLDSNGDLDENFNKGTPSSNASGANGSVMAMAVQSNGKIIIGGNFTAYNGTLKNRIARLNADGSLDETFYSGSGANSYVYSIAIQEDGKILIGGYFTYYDGKARSQIARLNTDGTVDETFDTGQSINEGIWVIQIQPDEKILIAGSFSLNNVTGKNNFTRLNKDGSLDETFNSGTGVNSYVSAIALQNDGKIIIGGNFTSYNGSAVSRIARIASDGTLDETLNSGAGANRDVTTIVLQADGKIIMGGSFNSYNGIQKVYIARIEKDGALDETYIPGAQVNLSPVLASVMQDDGKIVIGGSQPFFNRFNSDGTLDETFITGTGQDNYIRTIALQNDGMILVGGDFSSYNGTGINRIARLCSIPYIVSSVPASRCDSGSVILSTFGIGETFSWYENETGGSPLGNGIEFVTPNLVKTTTYYVEAFNDCGRSKRTAVTATINITPIITEVVQGSNCGTGSISLEATASEGNINWFDVPSEGLVTGTGSTFTTPVISENTTYYVEATNKGCTSANRTEVPATIIPIPAQPTISASNSTSTVPILISSSDLGNQWFRDDVAIANATDKTYTVAQSGTYKVQVTVNTCVSVSSEGYPLVVTGIEQPYTSWNNVYPNPARDRLAIDLSAFETGQAVIISIKDISGKSIMQTTSRGGETIQVDIQKYTSGIYVLLLMQGQSIAYAKFFKSL